MNCFIEIKNDAVLSLLSNDDIANLNDVLSFKSRANYFSIGRTGYLPLKTPIVINGTNYKGIKIKGCGYGSPNDNKWEAPGLRPFVRESPHFGFNNDGMPIKTFSQNAPFGGITLLRALAEYKNFSVLIENNVNCLYPLMVVRYDAKFDDDCLAAMVALCHDYPPIRMNRLLIAPGKLSEKEYEYFNLISNEILKTNYSYESQWALCQYVAKQYSKSIRNLNEIGLYIHSGGWSNIQFSLQKKDIVLIDLDSTRELCEKPKSIWGLYAVRDLISNIYRLLINLYNPKTICIVNEGIIKDTDLVYFLLAGYFEGENSHILKYCSREILSQYLDCFSNIKQIEAIMEQLDEYEQKQYELNMFEFYNHCMKLLYPIFTQSQSKLINEQTLPIY